MNEDRVLFITPGVAGQIGNMRAEHFGVKLLGLGHCQPSEGGPFMYCNILDTSVDKWFSVFMSYSGRENLRISWRRMLARAQKGGTMYVIPPNQEELHPYSYRYIMRWLSPEFHSIVIQRQREFLLSLERFNPVVTAHADDDEESAAPDVDYH